MKKYNSILLITLFSLLSGCTSQKQNNNHIGTWEADIGEENMLIWKLDVTKLYYTLNERSETNSYIIDYSKEPTWFDSHISDSDIHCIMEFINNDSFRIVGSENEDPRPISFEDTEDILTFKRMNK